MEDTKLKRELEGTKLDYVERREWHNEKEEK